MKMGLKIKLKIIAYVGSKFIFFRTRIKIGKLLTVRFINEQADSE
jgi:hypothetical protein